MLYGDKITCFISNNNKMNIYKKILNIFGENENTNNHYLNDGGSSFISLTELSDDLKFMSENIFDDLFELKPKVKNKVIVHDMEIDVNRHYMSYLTIPKYDETEDRSYMYTDKSLNYEKELPDKFKIFFEHINSVKKGKKYNQIIINWYDVSDSIKYHADCQIGLDKDEPITILTLLENSSKEKEHEWNLIFKPKRKTKGKRVSFKTYNGLILSMNGKTQETHLHGINSPFKYHRSNRRISMTFRVCEK